jgi:hypothetical protein
MLKARICPFGVIALENICFIDTQGTKMYLPVITVELHMKKCHNKVNIYGGAEICWEHLICFVLFGYVIN